MGTRSSHQRHLGFCIFCGGAGETDDHVVPLALGGTDVLHKSSCESCRDQLNTKIDAPVLNGKLLFPRMIFKRQRSKKRSPRTEGKVRTVPGGQGPMVEVTREFESAPRRLIMWTTERPWLLDQSRPRRVDGGFTLKSCSAYISPGSMFSTDESEIFFSSEVFLNFYRMIAKIGLASAYLLSENWQFEPIIQSALVDENSVGILDFVGEGPPFDLTEKPYQLALRTDGKHLVASVQIFADMRMPTYDVVVARRAGWALFS